MCWVEGWGWGCGVALSHSRAVGLSSYEDRVTNLANSSFILQLN